MLILPGAVKAWHTDDFPAVLKAELEALAPASLPLHKGVSQAGMVGEAPMTVIVLNYVDEEKIITGKLGVFFTEVVINCGCGDDPMQINAYCELLIGIDKATAAATINVVTD